MEEFKAKILSFVQSLSVEEPFDGDEVGELSRYFVKALCQQNGEDDQVEHILAGPENDKHLFLNAIADAYEDLDYGSTGLSTLGLALFDQCMDIYKNAEVMNGYDGQSAVISHCEELGHPDWGNCEDCECVAPFVLRNEKKKCLICSFGNIVE